VASDDGPTLERRVGPRIPLRRLSTRPRARVCGVRRSLTPRWPVAALIVLLGIALHSPPRSHHAERADDSATGRADRADTPEAAPEGARSLLADARTADGCVYGCPEVASSLVRRTPSDAGRRAVDPADPLRSLSGGGRVIEYYDADERVSRREIEIDRDMDGRVDVVEHLDPDGRLLRRTLDNDGDGRLEISEYYDAGGRRVRAEVDVNGDGSPDRWIRLGTDADRIEIDHDFDGTIDQVQELGPGATRTERD